MFIRRPERRGFKLIELIAIVAIVGITLGLAVRAITAAREASRTTQCTNNMRHLGLALLNFNSTRNRFPNAGTFFDDPEIHQGDLNKSNIARALLGPSEFAPNPAPWRRNWVVDILAYLDSSDPSNGWDHHLSYCNATSALPPQPSNLEISSTSLSVFRCPSDPTTVADQGNLSYVVNGGFSRWHALPVGWEGGKLDGESKNGGVLNWPPAGSDWRATQAVARRLGVMFLGTTTGDQPWDIATGPNDIPDGASQTLLLGENTLVGYSTGTPHSGGVVTNWACPLPNFCMFIGSDDICHSPRSTTDCLAGSLTPTPQGADGPGWKRANQPGTHENIGFGQTLRLEGSFPFANSAHPGGGNFVFCDGSTRFLSHSIDGTVYAKLLSPAGSDLPSPLRQGPLAADVLK